ncbi:EAL domain-containing protein [Pseudoxanthobacter sp. M-2]|uniref:putative bifunctional diguanylate cyclase/phosphodiesterase n=1 Tax=Pseudoxanthobacter sp. M-2 TaxID=3078754 RepID=UPI0038FCF55D
MLLRDLIATVARSSLSELLDSICDLAANRHAFRGVSIALNSGEGLVQGHSAHFRAYSPTDWHSLHERLGPHVALAPVHRVDDQIAVRFAAAEAAMTLHAEPDATGTGGAALMAIGLALPVQGARDTVVQTLSGLLRGLKGHVQDHFASQAALARLRHMLTTVETLARVGVWEVDPTSHRLHWSDEIYRLHGVAPGREPDVETALGFYPEPARTALRGHLERLLEHGESFDLTVPIDRADGERRVVRAIGASDPAGRRARSAFGVFQDVTSQARREEDLWRAANHDPLTGLPNRRAFADRLAAACVQARSSGTFGVAIIADLDSFKVINDVHGHDIGDRVLVAMAERIGAAVPLAGRVGGDEFGLVATGFATRREAQEAARRLIGDLAFDFSHDARQVPITATAGACVMCANACDSAEVLRSADIALMHAKRRGRREVAFYEARFGDELIRRDQTLTRMRAALARGGVVPYYQPQVDVASGAVIGVEVLARQVLDGKVTAAADFEDAFADGALAVSIGRVVLGAACRDLGQLRRQGILPPRLSINVAPMEICYPDYTRNLLAQLEAHGIPPSDVLVEITEDVLLGRDQEEVHEALDELAHGGLRVAFDDFGTGYASLIHLASYPVHQVKIDKRFIAEIVTDPVSQAVVRGVVEVSRARAIEVAAEGVETARQLAMLRAIGCDVVQGYHIARPMPFEALAALLANGPILGGGRG